jgi:hypothetical protein
MMKKSDGRRFPMKIRSENGFSNEENGENA